jgi:hypothetical protein
MTGSKEGPNPGVFMGWHNKRIKWGTCTVGALTAAVLAMSTTPAAASGSYSGLDYVYGADTYIGDWSNEGVVDRDTHASSNATCLWQAVLWADGFLYGDEVDGVFGTRTYNATKDWQEYQNNTNGGANLTLDGSAGKQSWTRAGEFLIKTGGSEAAGQTLYLAYKGSMGWDLPLKRDADGNYHFRDGNGDMRKAGYNYRSCS